jgi:hypothetical protein
MPQRLTNPAVAADARTSGTATAAAIRAAHAATTSANRRRPADAERDCGMGLRLLA